MTRFATITITLALSLDTESVTIGPRKFTVRAGDPFDFADDVRDGLHATLGDVEADAFAHVVSAKYAQDYAEEHTQGTATVKLGHAGGERTDIAVGNIFSAEFVEDFENVVRRLWRDMQPARPVNLHTRRGRERVEERGGGLASLVLSALAGYMVAKLWTPAPTPTAEDNAFKGPPDAGAEGCDHCRYRDGVRVDCTAGCGAPIGGPEPHRRPGFRELICTQCEAQGCPCCNFTGSHTVIDLCHPLAAAHADDQRANLDRAAFEAERARGRR